MKVQLKLLFYLLIVFMITACESLGVSTQETPPGEISTIIETFSSTPRQITYSQMTGTAQAIPSVPFVIEPTQTPAMPSERDPMAVSPNGLYAIACKDPGVILFNRQTNTIISTFNYFPSDCRNEIHWASDSSYALFGTLYRWHVDGSQPEALDIHVGVDPNNYVCSTTPLYKWSPDKKYLVVKKCGITVVVQPFNESSLISPLLINNCCVENFRWVTPRLLLVEYFKAVSFVQIPSGNALGGISTSGGICTEQIPLMSPDSHWMVFDVPWCGGGERGPNQSVIANLEDGSERIFSESFADRIDFVNWSQDGSKLYVVSRPTEIDALPDPRTPYGLLAMNPKTLQIQNLFEQAWFVSFDKDFRWAYVVFPVKNDDGSSRLDGGLWEAGSSQLISTQIMARSLDEKFLKPVPYFGVQPFYSASGEELGSSSTAAFRVAPAIWSHDNLKIATINSDHQLVMIDLTGDIQMIGQLNDIQEWLYSEITWSDDDRSIDVDGETWPLP